jgi:diguanylate cyclase (GGDEF)-like protein
VALLGLAASAHAAKVPHNLVFSHILPEQVETLGPVATITEDTQGFMWFGGENGLARYDGYEIKLYRRDDSDNHSISANHVNHMLLTRSGQLWVATRGGLNLYQPETDNFKRYLTDPESAASSDIRALLEDQQGRLWLASTSGFYRFHPARNTITRIFDENDQDNRQTDGVIWTMVEDHDGAIWLGHNTSGITRYHPNNHSFRHYRHDPQAPDDQLGLTHNTVRTLFVDSKNRVWAGTMGGGVNRLDRSHDRFVAVNHFASEKSDTVVGLNETPEGFILLGDGTSVHVLDPATQAYSRFRFSEESPSGPGNYVVRTIYRDSNDDIWIGYFPSGVDFIDKRASVFNNYSHNTHNPNTVADGGVLAGLEDDQGNLWVGAGFGLNYFERDQQRFTRYQHDPQDPRTMSGSTVLSIVKDSHKQLWVGLWDRGLNRRDPETGHFIHYLPDPDQPGSLVGREPWDLLLDNNGVLWAITEEALNRYHPETDTFSAYTPDANQLDGADKMYGRSLYQDKQNNIWVGGVHGLYLFDRKSKRFVRHYRHDESDPNSLSNNLVWTIYEDSRQQLWVGTGGGGVNLLDRDTGTFTAFGLNHGLLDPTVTGVVEDDAGYLWLSTLKGLSRFDTQTHNFRHYDKSTGLGGNMFNRNTPVKLSSGELFFGSTKGFTLFDPQDLTINTKPPSVAITEFLVFNQPVPMGEHAPLQKSINTASAITLKNNQSMFSFEFAALNFRSPQDNQYAYRLAGFDDQWNYVGNKRSATYTNLNPGSYTFHVKASNNDGIWNETGTSIKVEILPPLWQTWWAQLTYLALLAGIIVWLIRAQQRKLAYARHKVEQERSLVKRLQEFDKLKDSFLANTSHELRTPLNGIIGLAQSLYDGATGPLPEPTRENLSMIVHSGERLNNLVNDILDFSKLENQGVTLVKKWIDLHVLVDVVLGLSWPLVGAKPLSLCNQVPHDLPPLYADEDRIIQVLHNIIGNAIKFTEQGTVTVSAQQNQDSVSIEVSDTGIGIEPGHLNNIFDAFHQVEDSTRRTHGGTGLGLLISKKLVELHGGSIQVQSTPGEGSSFSFSLPTGASTSDTVSGNTEPQVSSAPAAPLFNPTASSATPSAPPSNIQPHQRHTDLECFSGSEATILVVDDDAVNRKVLSNYLSLKNYRIIEASNGPEALAAVNSQQDIDLILLDIMMPKMSGYDVCRQLREDYPAQELPIVFLTTRSQMDDLVMGFDLGANDFLTKPIAREELLSRVHTHLKLHGIVRNLDKIVALRTEELAQKNLHLSQMKKDLEKTNSRLEEVSLTDPLTGLRNRRFLNKCIPADTALSVRNYHSWLSGDCPRPSHDDLVFMLLDIDHFKAVNDQYGHGAGDRFLEQISAMLSDIMRDSDYLIRWGGEEFLLVMRFCAREQAAEMAERIRHTIAEREFDIGSGITINKTMSIGFAAYPFYPTAPEALGWEQVIDTADRALYAAKHAGRNCWVGLESGDTVSEPLNPHSKANLASLVTQHSLRVISNCSAPINKI